MKQTIRMESLAPTYCMLDGITFAQVPYWFPFYDTRDLKLNLLRPFSAPEDRRPLLVWICGGAFITMDRSAHTPYLLKYVEKGYIVASIEYRRSNSGHFPAPLEDVKSAIRYLRAHADAFGIDPARVAVMGESAGGYLAGMAGVTGGTREFDKGEHLEQSSAVQAVVDFYGPGGLSSAAPADDPMGRPRPHQMLLGYTASCDPAAAAKADMNHYIDAHTPPFFILHGTADPLVPPAGSERLYEDLQKAGVRAELRMIEGAGHASPHFYQDSLCTEILAFLDSILR